DLDHTLHSGVLGEDGIDGVELTPGHIALQQYIKGLQERGIFVALVSRNEREDVEALFAKRSDYPLKWDDFSAIEVSWGDKGDAIARIAKALRIAVDAVVFVDDNPGELASVSMRLSNVHTIYAHADAEMTRRALHFYPGLWRWAVSADDAKRIQDLKAMAEREALAENVADPAEYFRSLQVALSYRHNPQAQLNRLADLCVKTNQFNLAVRRFNQAELQERMLSGDACVSSVQLSDRLSDSGVIAVIVAERSGSKLIVEELCISCRAMGRKLEDTIVIQAIHDMPIFAGSTEVAFRVQEAPRNQPATKWLADFIGEPLPLSPGLYSVNAEKIRDFNAI
ncbi:HAD-IIIC family phosphatase, partial [Streptomyces virginiae]|uniref:HAD-IIIC family phosphatase n=1 Tax=Streptomyces virginiae TaxID=1961 RepID=UPI0035DCEC3E